MGIEFDWSNFTRKITIPASPDSIINMWLTSDAIESWFLKTAIYHSGEGHKRVHDEPISKGDRFTWTWYTYDEYAMEGEILDVVAGQSLSFTFEDCVVTVSAYPNEGIEGGSILELHQSGIQVDEANKMRVYVGCSGSWMYHMTNLKCYMLTGTDLRSKTTSGVINN